MSAQPPSPPAVFPPELWESAFLHLAPEQILKLRAVNCSFRDIIDGSPEVQYLIGLRSAGLEVGYQDPSITFADRRKQLDRYRSHWDSLQWVEHTSLTLPPSSQPPIVDAGVICLKLLAGPGDTTTDYRFIQLPSVLRGIPLKQWTVRGLPNDSLSLGFLPEEDLLVVCSQVDLGWSFVIQLFQMSDGQPHPSASTHIINGARYGRARRVNRIHVQVTCSRLALTVLLSGGPYRTGTVSHLVVWDWKTGVKHADVTARCSQSVQFVDEYRIFGVSQAVGPGSRWSVTLLDTSVPVEDPREPREIEFELNNAESLRLILFKQGTYARGARLGSPFWTDRKGHVLCIKSIWAPRFVPNPAICNHPLLDSGGSGSADPGLRRDYWVPGCDQTFVIDYESICAIASKNGAALRIPWDLWKHETMPIDLQLGFPDALQFVGPRVLVIDDELYQGPSLRSLDFIPGARRFKKIHTSLDAASRYATHHAKLADTFPEGDQVRWDLLEDNVLAFRRLSSVRPQLLEIWTF